MNYFYIDCDGQAYIFSGDLAKKLYNVSLHEKFFVFEDVYVGILASKINSIFDLSFIKYYATFSHEKIANIFLINLDLYFIIYTNYESDSIILWNAIYSKIKKKLNTLNKSD